MHNFYAQDLSGRAYPPQRAVRGSGPWRSHAERLPHAAGHLILDLALLRPGKRIVPGGEVRAHVPHADGPHHAPGASVHRHGLRDYPALPGGVKSMPQQGTGRLAGQALPPVPADETVTQVRDGWVIGLVGTMRGRKHHEPDEFALPFGRRRDRTALAAIGT